MTKTEIEQRLAPPAEMEPAHTLFGPARPCLLGPRPFAMSAYRYMRLSTRPGVGLIRSLLEDWFQRISPEARTELRRRFRSEDDRQHIGAFFELYCNELLRVQGYNTVKQLASPDFVATKNNVEIMMEATATCESDSLWGNLELWNLMLDELGRICSPDFHLGLDSSSGYPPSPEAVLDVKAYTEAQLRGLDYDTEARNEVAGEPYPCWTFTHPTGWNLKLSAYPKVPESRGEAGRSLVIWHMPTGLVDTGRSLARALCSKALAFGDANSPTIIAVNQTSDFSFVDDIDVVDVLFGADWGAPVSPSKRDGFFLKATPGHISAVLLVKDLKPWSIARRPPVLWLNPFAISPLDISCWRIAYNAPADGTALNEHPGEPAHVLFGLTPKWPEED
ncbi:MAG: hypothetical protein Q8P50_08120 [Bacillota bacterium]|nr:hypothetical protein [Bacillota bacterium]